VIFTILR